MGLPKPNHTQIANDFIENWMPVLNGGSVKVFLAIARKTIGWHKETDAICYDQLTELTGMSRPSISKAIESLVNHGLIDATKRPNRSTVYEINYDVVVKKLNHGSKETLPQGSKETLPTKETTKETSTKETSTSVPPHGAAKSAKEQPYQSDFEEWWRLYPRKKEKKRAYKQYAALRRKGVDKQSLLDAVKGYTEECRKDGREERFIKHAATFLGPAESWREYVENGDEISSKKAEEKLEMQRVKREISYDDYIARLKQLRGEVS